MTNSADSFARGSLDGILREVDSALDSRNNSEHKKLGQVRKRDLEVALTVLLVDLASCDQHFDRSEYNVIMQGLRRVFGTSKDQVSALVNQAQTLLAGLRGTDSFTKTLAENLGEDDKIAIMEVIDDIIEIDGVEDGFETFFRGKIATLLGLEIEEEEIEETV